MRLAAREADNRFVKSLKERLDATGQLLVRSGIDVSRTLQEFADSGAPITAALQSGELFFASRLLRVDEPARQIVIACSPVKEANSALLTEGAVQFSCNHRGVHYQFVAGSVVPIMHEGAPALQLELPSHLLAQQRRQHDRIRVPGGIELRCIVPFGPMSFEARVVDISTQGIGTVVYDAGIRVEPGMRLEKARIMPPRKEPIEVDLLVRHVARQPMPDGSYAMRAGCSFIGAPKDIEQLIELFVTALDGRRPS